MSHMLHFSSLETFLCSSWLCALQAAILEEIQANAQKTHKVLVQISLHNRSDSHLISRPSMYSFFFFLLSWADCLLRIFLRIFFRIRSSHWLRKGCFQRCAGWRRIQGAVTGGGLPSWGAAGWAESPPPLPTASSHLHWESAPVRSVGKSVAAAEEMHGVNTNVEWWFKIYWWLQEKTHHWHVTRWDLN